MSFRHSRSGRATASRSICRKTSCFLPTMNTQLETTTKRRLLMKRRFALIALALIGAVVPAAAILGIGDIVFDPTNYGEAIQQLIQLEQQYEQLVKTYQKVESQYNHMLYMAQSVPVNMIARYRAL